MTLLDSSPRLCYRPRPRDFVASAILMVTILHFIQTCVWDYFPLFPENENLSLQMTGAIRDLRCICREVRDYVDLHAARHLVKRKGDRLAHIAEEYPTFAKIVDSLAHRA